MIVYALIRVPRCSSRKSSGDLGETTSFLKSLNFFKQLLLRNFITCLNDFLLNAALFP